jgi:hypothetical protein
MDSNDVERWVEQGILAAKSNYKEQAEQYLRRAVTMDPSNEKAWLWLSAVVEDISEKRECLHRVIELEPSNPYARSGLRFLGSLREGYEYMAARAPWMYDKDGGPPIPGDKSTVECPRCGAPNPAWAYTCSDCDTPLEKVDVASEVHKQMIKGRRSSIVRPWTSAIVLNATEVFAPEVELASIPRSIWTIALAALACNLLRLVSSLGLTAFTNPGQFASLIDPLATAFVVDLGGLLLAGWVIWAGLATLTMSIADSLGGMGSTRIHFYLIAVAVSSWMAVDGLVGVAVTAVILLLPGVSPTLVIALASGLLFFYALTLVAQAVHATHGLQPLQETGFVGLILGTCVVAYGGILALLPAGAQLVMFKLFQLVMLPIAP